MVLPITTDGQIRYTVPHVLTAKADTKVFFRVRDVFRDKKITVRDGDTVIYQKKKIKLAPGEMETVTLTAEMIGKIQSGSLHFSLED